MQVDFLFFIFLFLGRQVYVYNTNWRGGQTKTWEGENVGY